MKNVMEKIEEFTGKVNKRYDTNLIEADTVYHSSKGPAEFFYNAFLLGYMRGHKAAIAEMKKKARAK